MFLTLFLGGATLLSTGYGGYIFLTGGSTFVACMSQAVAVAFLVLTYWTWPVKGLPLDKQEDNNE